MSREHQHLERRMDSHLRIALLGRSEEEREHALRRANRLARILNDQPENLLDLPRYRVRRLKP